MASSGKVTSTEITKKKKKERRKDELISPLFTPSMRLKRCYAVKST